VEILLFLFINEYLLLLLSQALCHNVCGKEREMCKNQGTAAITESQVQWCTSIIPATQEADKVRVI
jgi:hypothetical protein